MNIPAKSVGKNSHNSTKKKRSANRVALFNDPKSLLTWRQQEPTDGVINHLMHSLIEWSELDSSIDFIDFFRVYGIYSNTYYDWTTKYPDLLALHKEIKQRLGARREKMAIYREKNCDPGTLKHTLRQYHPEWEAAWNSEAALRTKVAGESKQPIVIELPALVEEEVGTANG